MRSVRVLDEQEVDDDEDDGQQDVHEGESEEKLSGNEECCNGEKSIFCQFSYDPLIFFGFE